MEIKDIIRIVKKGWRVIVSSFFICLVASILVAYFALGEIFQADTIMIISSPQGTQQQNQLTLNDYTLNTKLVDSYKVLCTTDRILNQVIQQTGLPLTVKQLAGKISVTAESDTEIIRITAEDSSPDTAAIIANAVANVFIQEIPGIMRMDNVQVIDKAVPQRTPVKPNRTLIVVVAALLGLLLGFAIAIVVDNLDVSIKSSEQLESLLGAPVLGVIPHMQEGTNKKR